jgi:mRNA-degrading endonuclease RelE of RelBE toxin-antitoxin system
MNGLPVPKHENSRFGVLDGENITYGHFSSKCIYLTQPADRADEKSITLQSPRILRSLSFSGDSRSSGEYNSKHTFPPWLIGYSQDFKKKTERLDQNLKGRIFSALGKITENATTILGDTVKPLSGELSGHWRYRIGDFRLIYYPDLKYGTVTLIDFGPRGDIYDN